MRTGLDRARRDPEPHRGLRDRPTPVEALQEYFPVGGGEPSQCLGDRPRLDGTVGLILGSGLRQGVRDDLVDPYRPAAPRVDREVPGGREQPGANRTTIGVERLWMPPRAQQRLLY